MSHINLVAQTREGAGKGVARKLRAKGQIPGVVYGPDSSPQLFSVEEKSLAAQMKEHGLNFIIELELDGKKQTCMIADYQRDVFQLSLTHIDLKRIDLKRKVIAKIPIALTGEADVRSRGGIAQVYLQQMTVRILPSDIPKVFKIDVSHLHPGQSMKLDAVEVPENFEKMDPHYTTVVNVLAPRSMAAARGGKS
jgi:large subunit ribosomal protein L25